MEDLLNYMPQEEVEGIASLIKDYAANGSDRCDFADTRYVLREWNAAKRTLFEDIFAKDDCLDIYKDISIEKTEEEMSNELYELLHKSNHYATTAFDYQFGIYVIDSINKDNKLVDLNKSLFYDEKNNCRSAWFDKFVALAYPSVVFTDPLAAFPCDFLVPMPDGKTYKVQRTAKIMRVLGKLAEAYGIPHFKEYCTAYSQVLNDKHFHTELHLSIHPLDFMTASLNDCSWSSCMTWDDGGYRQGTVEMMNSPCVLVAYTKSSEDMTLPNGFYWNNKHWREFIIVTEEGIFPIKGYPYWNRLLELEVINFIRERIEGKYDDTVYVNSFKNHKVVNIYSKEYLFSNMEDEDKSRYKVNDLVPENAYLSFSTAFMYNDFYTNHLCVYSHSYLREPAARNIIYSGISECMICGTIDSISESEDLACQTCYFKTEDFLKCDCCGGYIREDRDDWVELGTGEIICEDCINSNDFAWCEDDSNYYYANYLNAIVFVDENNKPIAHKWCHGKNNEPMYITDFNATFTTDNFVDTYDLIDEEDVVMSDKNHEAIFDDFDVPSEKFKAIYFAKSPNID